MYTFRNVLIFNINYRTSRTRTKFAPFKCSNIAKNIPTDLTGEALFDYLVNTCNDKGYASIVKLLPYVVGDLVDVYNILGRTMKEDKHLVIVYPGIKNIDTLGYIGSVPDGSMYIDNNSTL